MDEKAALYVLQKQKTVKLLQYLYYLKANDRQTCNMRN